MKQPRTEKNPLGAGRKRKCACNTFGCIPCMNRFIYAHYQKNKKKYEPIAPEISVNTRIWSHYKDYKADYDY